MKPPETCDASNWLRYPDTTKNRHCLIVHLPIWCLVAGRGGLGIPFTRADCTSTCAALCSQNAPHYPVVVRRLLRDAADIPRTSRCTSRIIQHGWPLNVGNNYLRGRFIGPFAVPDTTGKYAVPSGGCLPHTRHAATGAALHTATGLDALC